MATIRFKTEPTSISEHSFPFWTTVVPRSKYVPWVDTVFKNDSVFSNTENIGLGFRMRSPTEGPEQELIDRFLNTQRFVVPQGFRLTVLLQPEIDTGFPDLVAVLWRESVTARWPSERLQLQTQDVRLLHLLSTLGWTDRVFLERVFPRGLKRSLERLQAADLIICGHHKCRIKSLNKIFAVERIVAIEAKIKWWRRAFEQASNNTWFSSVSYVLLPPFHKGPEIVKQAEKLGIGLLAQNDDEFWQLFSPEFRNVPLSYGSWLFNEWVWRISQC